MAQACDPPFTEAELANIERWAKDDLHENLGKQATARRTLRLLEEVRASRRAAFLDGGGAVRSTGRTLSDIALGTEWIVDAHGCHPSSLRSCDALSRLFARIVEELGLHPAAQPVWHVFPGQGGITGMLLLTESHLACHTFPERGFAAFDLYCCRPLQEWPWAERLADALGAADVRIRLLPRGER